MQDAINHALDTGDFTGEAYDAAVNEYMDRYCNYWLGEDAPECCKRPKKSGSEAYVYGWGPNEFAPTGTLKDFEYVEFVKGYDFTEDYPIVLLTWGGIKMKNGHDHFDDDILILNRTEFLENLNRLISIKT